MVRRYSNQNSIYIYIYKHWRWNTGDNLLEFQEDKTSEIATAECGCYKKYLI